MSPTSTSTSLSPTFVTTLTPIPTTPSNGNGGNGPTSSPLLFFVALGFGVVFTNLWIIVGVKYCFRYNARQRARANGEEEPVDLQVMPRPHRRRREKKLMSLDEVNERFPATKYKSWRAHRESMGLSSEGGIKTEPNSRPGSVKNAEAAISPVEESPISPIASNPLFKEVLGPSTVDKEASSSGSDLVKETLTPLSLAPPTNETNRLSEISDIDHQKDSDNDDDDEEHLHAAVPDELLNTSGDSCAICIDVIDDDDDIRGLTCGHAFHTGCLDPWLTSRRACCPLCKADYYISKPRAEAESSSADENGDVQSRSHRQEREPAIPQEAYIAPPFHRRMLFSGRFIPSNHGSGASRSNNSNPGSSTAAQAGSDAGTGGNRWMRNPLRGVLPSARRGENNLEEPTPGALEAGLANEAEIDDSTPAQRPAPIPSPSQDAGTH